MKTGAVKMWSPKGFGFILPDDGGANEFVHVSALLDGEKELFVGDRVSYEVEIDKRKNKNQAVRVRIL